MLDIEELDTDAKVRTSEADAATHYSGERRSVGQGIETQANSGSGAYLLDMNEAHTAD